MVYLIDGRIKYRTEDGAIWLTVDESTTIVLTITMNRLLSFLIQRRGTVVSRDEIFEHVWDAHGLRSSNNSLNKYVSELRKTLSGFDVADGGISTIPRVGLMFGNDLIIQETEAGDDITITLEKHPDNTPVHAGYAKATSRRTIYFLMTALGLVTLTISIAAFYYSPIPIQQSLRQGIATQLLFNFNGCPVYTTQKNSEALTSLKIDIFNEMASSKNINCLAGTVFLYQPSDAFIYGHKGRVFLTRCTMNKETKNDFASCLSFYWSDYAI